MNSIFAFVIEAGLGIEWMFGFVADALLDPFDFALVAGFEKLFLLTLVI